MDILAEIFDFEDPDVFNDVSKRLIAGNVIRGHYDPSTGRVAIHNIDNPRYPAAYEAFRRELEAR